MRWASAASELPDADAAAEEALAGVVASLGEAPDLALVFCGSDHSASAVRLADRVRAGLDGALVVGCTARSVIGAGREIEERPALSITAARLPRVSLRAVRIAGEGFPRGTPAWRDAFELAQGVPLHFVLLADPWSCDVEALVQQIDQDLPGSVLLGGVASGAERPGENALLLEHRIHRDGLVGVAMWGDVTVDGVIAQGCRPIGQPLFVTRCRGHRLVELDGRKPMDVVRELYEAADPRDRALMQGSLFLGLEMGAERHEFRRGDFLIRNLVGADPDSGALAVAAGLHEGQVVQFHLRDARTSAEDLEERLGRYCRDAGPGGAPRGALLFSCLGRGAHLYGRPGHDSELFRRHLGALPLGGFFCNGEIGPVGGRTFLHGYTSAFGIFRPRSTV
jgi:small ligand-binding sensory domain FIST